MAIVHSMEIEWNLFPALALITNMQKSRLRHASNPSAKPYHDSMPVSRHATLREDMMQWGDQSLYAAFVPGTASCQSFGVPRDQRRELR
jgi:hypothetical protein